MIRASERGAYEYLPKPFDLKELVGIVGRALAEPKRRKAGEVEAAAADTMPLTRRAKLAMMAESATALLIMVVVAARAISVLA